MRSVARTFGGGIILLLALLLLAAPAPADVPPGFDLFETDPEQTVFSFRDEATIPPGFFDDGSAAFTGDVAFAGVPINRFMGHDVGDADTVVQRPGPFVLAPPFPDQASGLIELRVLSLVSVQPIEVQVGDSAQLWDVSAVASPTRPSTGEIDVEQTSAGGGQFNSRLTVYPKFTFTRLSDGEQRVLDVGSTPQAQDPTFVQKITLSSQDTPWRAGCVPPALLVPGINDGFCPGQTVDGLKRGNLEIATLARHHVLPVQPRLEHFSCHSVAPAAKLGRRKVKLRDQFGKSSARVLGYGPLCAPARKNKEPFRNKRAHLQCYGIRRLKGKIARRFVAVRNQFGSQRLRLTRASGLCLPSLKTRTKVGKPKPLAKGARIDSFACYLVRQQSAFKPRSVVVRDQFGRSKVRVLRPASLCAPVSRNGRRVLHPVRHLVCYRIKRKGKFKVRKRRVHNEFGHRVVKVGRPTRFCVPSAKLAFE